MSSKQIASLLLSENESNISKLNNLLEESYKETLKEIFNIFYNYVLSGTKEDIYIILDNIEELLLNQEAKYSKEIISSIKFTIYKFSNVNVHENIEIRNIKFRLLDLIRKLNDKKEKTENENLYNVYHSIIFKERDLKILELVLKQEKNILKRKDEKGNDLFYNILDYYSSLEEEQIIEIEYFHEVIMLFFRLEEDIFVKNSKVYFPLLERDICKEKKHVMEITRQLYGFSSVDIKELKRKYDVSTKIHDDIIKELDSFKISTDGRIFIDEHFITIDEEEATCLDDALSMVQNKDGSYNFYVGITDIPSIVPYQSRTYYDALRKHETLYLCDGTIDLYHPRISHDIGSLIMGKDRNAIIYKFLADPYFNIDPDSLEIIKGVLNVGKRLSYGMVNRQENITIEECKMIENMYFLAMKLRRQNSHKDEYRKLENLIHHEAIHHHSLFADKSISANIVQESMLLVNSSAPRYFSKRGLIYDYRNHKLPNDKAINKEIDRLLKMNTHDMESTEYIKLINSIKEMYLNAYYSIDNKGHEGLGYDNYSHSSSPARRFTDAHNQYLTHFQVFNKITNDRDYYELEEEAREVVKHMNERKMQNDKFENEYNYIVSKIRTLKR